ncbi:hypothetical protein VV02_22440 [Luteipulveratus mongoliensis]|uniref:Uncharacterized protein n=1 Tax=Luteipulveratus mongoliensis TaxID=571913 RepID=A0A0K1JMN1_9MICO|nr:hypothetical protein VV02_22440 [Luteipulveratus mongoliensis]
MAERSASDRPVRTLGRAFGFLYVIGFAELWTAMIQRDFPSRDRSVSEVVNVAYWSVFATYAGATVLILVMSALVASCKLGLSLALLVGAAQIPTLVVLVWAAYFASWGSALFRVPDLLPAYLVFSTINVATIVCVLHSARLERLASRGRGGLST